MPIPDREDTEARLLREAAEQVNYRSAEAIVRRVKILEQGLPAEDEFSAILYWLGRCRFVHKLDQTPTPLAAGFKAPDLLAVFDGPDGQIPVLIEVKRSKGQRLSWTSKYLEPLKEYAATLRLPLLVAWNWGSFWVLFEAKHFSLAKTNWTISLVDATKQTLMGHLAGDFSFRFHGGVSLNLKMRKLAKTPTGNNVQIEDVYFADPEGRRAEGDAAGVHLLFMCFNDEATADETPDFLHQRFTIPVSNQSEFAHRALATALSAFRGNEPFPRWRGILEKGNLPLLTIGGPRRAATLAQANGLMGTTFTVVPKTTPSFLSTHERGQ